MLRPPPVGTRGRLVGGTQVAGVDTEHEGSVEFLHRQRAGESAGGSATLRRSLLWAPGAGWLGLDPAAAPMELSRHVSVPPLSQDNVVRQFPGKPPRFCDWVAGLPGACTQRPQQVPQPRRQGPSVPALGLARW